MIKHQRLVSEPVNTAYGVVQLDGEGTVINIKELSERNPGVNIEQALADLPTFYDANVFGGEEAPDEQKESVETPAQEDAPTINESDKAYYEVIKELETKPSNLNSAGYVEMDVLNAKLRELNLPILAGTRRIEITDLGRKMDAFAKNGI